MNYTGTIIQESLTSELNLSQFCATILKTEVEKVTKSHETPWLNQWTLITFTVPDENADELSEALSNKLLSSPSTWYADFKNEKSHYIIFPHKIFHIERTAEEYRKVREYGLSQGIPEYQLDFSPDIP